MLNKRLKEIRTSLKLTQQEMANKLNISRVRYNQYETGKRQPDNEMLKIISKTLNMSIDYLLGRSDIKNPDELLDHNNKLVTVLYDEEMQAAFKDYDSWTVEDKKELIAYLNAKRVMRENKDK